MSNNFQNIWKKPKIVGTLKCIQNKDVWIFSLVKYKVKTLI